MKFNTRLQLAMSRADKSQAQLARAANVTPATISAFVLGRNSPRSATAIAMANALNVRVEWLIDGIGPMHPRAVSDGLAVPLLDAAASAGPGIDRLQEDNTLAEVVLNQTFVDRHLRPTQHTNLRFLHAYGDSMLPSIHSGDLLLVDIGQRSCDINAIYVFTAHDRIYVKRVRRDMITGVYEIYSENENGGRSNFINSLEEVTVLGRVLYALRPHKL